MILLALLSCTIVLNETPCDTGEPSDGGSGDGGGSDSGGTIETLGWTAVGAGGLHSCGIRLDGRLRCWGNDSQGQSTPPAGTFLGLAIGYQHGCTLDAEGTATCWGRNDQGQASPPLGSFSTLSAGGGHSCALDAAGLPSCWGRDDLVPSLASSGPDRLRYRMLRSGTCGLRH